MWWAWRSMRPPGGALARDGGSPAQAASLSAAATWGRPSAAAAAAPAPRNPRRVRSADMRLLAEPDGNVDEQVLLAADEAALAGGAQQLVRRHVVALADRSGVLEEARVDARQAERDGVAIDDGDGRLQRRGDLFGDVEQGRDVDPCAHAGALEQRGDDLSLGVARAGAERPQRAVDLDCAGADRRDGVGLAQA